LEPARVRFNRSDAVENKGRFVEMAVCCRLAMLLTVVRERWCEKDYQVKYGRIGAERERKRSQEEPSVVVIGCGVCREWMIEWFVDVGRYGS